MASPKKTPNAKSWEVDFYPVPGAPRIRKKGFPRKKDAEAYIAARKAEHKDDTVEVKLRFSSICLQEIATKYNENHLKIGKASDNSSYISNICKEFGEHVLSKITPKDVREYFSKMFSGEIVTNRGNEFSVSSIKKHLTYFKRIFNYAIEQEIIALNPIKDIYYSKEFKKITKRNNSISVENFYRFYRLFDQEPWWAQGIICLLWHTGMRIGEVRNLKWSEIDINTGVITLDADRVKEGRTRTIGVEKEALNLLISLKEINNKKGANNKNHVFGITFEKEIHYQTVYKMFRKVVNNTEFTKFNIHDIRHSYAIRKRREGWDKEIIKVQMGHVSDSMWNWYNDVAADEVAEMSGYNSDHQKLIDSDINKLVEKMNNNGISVNTAQTVFREKLAQNIK